jgi:dihydrofolate synthase/folylpolyglutamate synthase
MEKRSLAEWLEYQQRVHPRSIELGLERVGAVWRRLGAPAAAPLVISVGGTNGKGSTVALLESMLAAQGRRVGCYTSPHLLRYNERVRVDAVEADDASLVDAFERIEHARAQTPLTYFEFGTLAALWIFAHSALDVALLEVGLGGRLDAVNIVDADAAIVTTIDLDHQDWLGNDRDAIGREKAGIFRAGRPAIIGAADAPVGLLDAAAAIGARRIRAGIDYRVDVRSDGWRWSADDTVLELPLPALVAPCQVDNAAAAIAALHSLRDRLGWNPQALARGVGTARLAARLQRFAVPGRADVIVDVAHNPQAARVLAEWVAAEPEGGRTFAVFGALDDKDVAGIVAPLRNRIDAWLFAGLERLTPRGLDAARLRQRAGTDPPLEGVACADPAAALRHALAQSAPGDRVLAFGSFYVAAAALEYLAGPA